MMFKKQIGKKMEVYVDEMLIKSKVASDHVAHLADMFKILKTYCMKLNPSSALSVWPLEGFWDSWSTNEA